MLLGWGRDKRYRALGARLLHDQYSHPNEWSFQVPPAFQSVWIVKSECIKRKLATTYYSLLTQPNNSRLCNRFSPNKFASTCRIKRLEAHSTESPSKHSAAIDNKSAPKK